MDTLKNVNGTVWIFAILLIAVVVIQSILFLRLALNFNKKNNVVTKAEINQSLRTGVVSAIGPAFSSMTIAISLIMMVGSGAAFMRCGVIGSPATEMVIADIGVSTVGVEFGTPEFTEAVFTLCIFCMTLAAAPYIINTIITLKPLDKAVEKAKKSEGRSFIPYLSNGALIGLLGYLIAGYFTSVASVSAVITAGIVCYLIMQLSKKINNSTLSSFSMAIAMIAAMIVGEVVTLV